MENKRPRSFAFDWLIGFLVGVALMLFILLYGSGML